MAKCDNCRKKTRTLKKVYSPILKGGQARMCSKCRLEFKDFKRLYEAKQMEKKEVVDLGVNPTREIK